MRRNERSDLTIRLGAIAWLLAAQFFVAQVIAASAWPTGFSVTRRNISDLGRTACESANQSPAAACSPLHAIMNGSFIIVGITMAAGAILARGAFAAGWRSRLAVALFVAAGVGVLMVGVYPANENITNHSIGAGLNFVCGNVALILFGLAMPSPPARPVFVGFSLASGVAGLIALVLFVSHHDLGVGPGVMERVIAYTTSVWQIVAGLVLLRQPESGG